MFNLIRIRDNEKQLIESFKTLPDAQKRLKEIKLRRSKGFSVSGTKNRLEIEGNYDKLSYVIEKAGKA